MTYSILVILLVITVLAIAVTSSVLNVEVNIENDNVRNNDLIDLCIKVLPALYALALTLIITMVILAAYH